MDINIKSSEADKKKPNHFADIKNSVFSAFPTTIRRSVCLENFISVDHSVNLWLYERWELNASTEHELTVLHQEMKQTIIDYSKNHQLEVKFVHYDPRINQQVSKK